MLTVAGKLGYCTNNQSSSSDFNFEVGAPGHLSWLHSKSFRCMEVAEENCDRQAEDFGIAVAIPVEYLLSVIDSSKSTLLTTPHDQMICNHRGKEKRKEKRESR